MLAYMRVLKPVVQNSSLATAVNAKDPIVQAKLGESVIGSDVSGWTGQTAPTQAAPTTTAQLALDVGFMHALGLGPVLGTILFLSGCASSGGALREAPAQSERPVEVQSRAVVTQVNETLLGTVQGVVQAARFLIDQHSSAYQEDSPWLNLDPNHPLPTNVNLGGMSGQSKCNLFVSQAMFLGGFEPPRYGNGNKGEYANANQIWKWSDTAAQKFGNPERFKMVSQASLLDLSYGDKINAITEVLRKAEPGDLLMVDHGPSATGEKVVNRGHARLVTDNPMARGGSKIAIANATDIKGAVEVWKTPRDLASEDHVWVLRPSRPRMEKKAATPITTPL